MNMKTLITFSAISALIILSACSSRIRLEQTSGWEIRTSKDSLFLELSSENTKVPVIFRDGNTPAFFYTTEAGIQHPVVWEQEVRNTPDSWAARYSTTDNRKMVIRLLKSPDGILRVQVETIPHKGILTTGVTMKAHEGEYFFGLTERPVDGPQSLSWNDTVAVALYLNGRSFKMDIQPTLSIYEPFYVSTGGYGIYTHGTQPGKYDMTSSDPSSVQMAFEGNLLTLSVIPGPEPIKVIQRFSGISGTTVLPPKWAFLPFRWRDNHTNRETFYDGTPNRAPYNSMVVEDLLMAEALDIPVGTYWVDRPWATGTRGYGNFNKWDPVRFPRAQEMINWINNRGQHFMVWVSPWVCDSLLEVATEKNYLMPLRAGDTVPPNPWILDFTDPEVRAWWGKQLNPLISMGVVAFKMDRSEEYTVRTEEILRNGKTAREMRNDYPRLYLKAAYDIMKQMRGEDFLLVPRAAYTGSQSMGVFWGGDIVAGEYGLRTALIALQRCSFMNFPVWGSDIGGYWGDDFSHDNLIRWLAFGAFCPIMEVGPLHDRAPWDMPGEPHYDTTLIATYRLYSILHARLQEYTYRQALEAHESGTPIVRPLAMAYPEDPETYRRFDEFLYGPDILVGIIWKNQQFTFPMYLPEGEWTDLWSGQTYTGNQNIIIDCPEYKIPIFLRKGAQADLPDPESLYRESLERARKVPHLGALVKEHFGTK